jgi:predicted ATPase/DNA-binding CsgD family transcriptional regulator
MFVGQATRQRAQLPVETTSFVGREAELARLSVLLGQARLVTVTGPGGVGKTRVALRAAAKAAPEFADGTCLVELSAVRDPGLLVNTVARALGLPEPGHGAGPGVLLTHLADRQVLLILDTCEHLVDGCAMLAEAIIARAPRVTLLATSREPLDVSGENACPVPPLPVPDLGGLHTRYPLATYPAVGAEVSAQLASEQSAEHDGQEPLAAIRPADYRGTAVDLFIQRASAAVPGFALSPGDLLHVARLCRRLDGMPLTIELAAVRLRALPLAELASRLDQSLALVTSGHRGGRHRSLRDAISWSYQLCTPAERAMWARLSVFAGPFTISAAEEICAGEAGSGDPSGDLSGAGSSREDDGPSRHLAGPVMPTLIRLVDKSLLLRIDPADAAGQPTQYLMPGTIREFGAEQLAGTAAESRCRQRLIRRSLNLANGFRSRLAADDQLTRLSELHREYASVRAALGYTLGGQDAAEPAGAVALDVAALAYRTAGNRASAGDSSAARDGAGARDAGPGLGSSWTADGIELAIALNPYWRIRCLPAEGCYWLGRAVVLAPAGSAARARALLARADLLTAAGRAADALSAAAAAAELANALGDQNLIARAQLVRNGAMVCAGQLAAAAEVGQEALRLLTAVDDTHGLISLHIQLGYLNLLNQDSGAALGHVDHGLRLVGGSRERWLHAVLYLLAALALHQAGRDTEATWTATRTLQVTEETGDTVATACAVELLGWIAARSGTPMRAAWLLGGADPLWERAGGRLARTTALGRLSDEAVAGCEAALGDRRFAELYARGAAQPSDAIISCALHDDGDQVADSGAKIRLPTQLTAREREIAGLVAGGLSNRQVAERLFISRRTVDAHLEHIFGKLGITSRVMLTIQLRDYPAEAASSAEA